MSATWSVNPSEVAVVIPTLNAGAYLDQMIPALQSQGLPSSSFLVVDSGSTDGTVERFEAFGAKVVGLNGKPFNHGGTRRYASELLPDAKFIIYQTHDAIPADPEAFFKLLAVFDDASIGLVYGRQLPRPGARAIERHARLFNYPDTNQVRSYHDRMKLGLKTIFCSDSFAAYRRSILDQVGGFPEDVYFGEDQIVAGRMLLRGYKIAYCADARVVHSHAYSLSEDFRRYFDVGVWHVRDPWMQEQFGKAEGEGARFLKSEVRYLLKTEPQSLPSAMVRTLAKYLGYQLGLREQKFTPQQKKKLAMQGFYWSQRARLEAGQSA